jgi:COP9 signalosome complex subunit 3
MLTDVQIEDGDISASIAADGSVTFSDPPPQFSRAEVDQVLRDVQNQGLFLEHLEQETAKSREYLSKAVKGKDDSAQWAGPPDEDMFSHSGPGGGGGMWEEMNFS